MPTRNVVLTERQDSLINTLVKSGRYQNASEVLREGLRLVEDRQAEEAARLRGLRQAIHTGLDDLAKGRHATFDSLDGLRTHLADLADQVLGPPRRR